MRREANLAAGAPTYSEKDIERLGEEICAAPDEADRLAAEADIRETNGENKRKDTVWRRLFRSLLF